MCSFVQVFFLLVLLTMLVFLVIGLFVAETEWANKISKRIGERLSDYVDTILPPKDTSKGG